ncbi:MAG: TrkH family potassium uptake protein [Nitrospirae bacterium]|nr:MAG: TrkH family potassium uptake protein [Nitrospirota bacterium]
MNWLSIINLTGAVILIVSLFMLIPVFVSLLYSSGDLMPLLISFACSVSAGATLFLSTRRGLKRDIRHRDGFLVVTLSWLLVTFFGSLPFLLSGTFSSVTDAYFEAMAGFTTTGASVLTDIESTPAGILFWRSLTQWLGGMGIVLFSIAVLPLLGGGGMQLFKAEVPEITLDKLRPRLIDTAKALWYIYTSLTVLAAILYFTGGMNLFDAINHAFTTMATGGFSTKNTSLAYFQSPFIDVVASVFMFLAGINYTIYFFAFRGDLSRFASSDEFRFYLKVTLIATLIITLNTLRSNYDNFFQAFRYAFFQVTSIMTTTGYATADYEKWSPFAQMILVVLMFFGGMIGSTGGGMKQVRVLLMLKQAYRELYQLVHPRAVTSLKLDSRHLPKEILGSIWGFLFLFIIIWVVATLLLTAMDLDLITSSTTVISALCNVGPALGDAGPTENYAGLPDLAKWVLTLCMLIGRLEVYTVVVIFIPRFWRS